ncbi:glycosyltransferase family 2 protein [Breznakia pachnodae]|uniref:GT2 family glycosyltransferase n=1 Tax=Breznakia pachnodae TaxID=265178 RepID=A0ABU0E412_9FIRM|nr:glycosyltransferase [Breznakia pachnodae]MDQ0361638.1 GT2 family glycosyltransferase [Breznakia pachnodae]
MDFREIYDNLTIIIPFHKNKEMIKLSIKTLLRTIPNDITIKVIANNYDKSQLSLKFKEKNIEVIRRNKNLFWPGAINLGAKLSNTEYLLFCDPDIFYWDNWLEELIKCYFSNKNVGVVSSKIINPLSNRIMDFGMAYLDYNVIHMSKGLPYNHPYTLSDREVQSACGAIFFTSKKNFELVNGIDTDMPYIYCDNAYCLKLLKHGLNTFVAANSCVYHIGDTNDNNSKYYSFRYLREDSKAAFYSKYINIRSIDYQSWLAKSFKWYKKNTNNIQENYVIVNLSTFPTSHEYIDFFKYNLKLNIYDVYHYPLKERNIKHISLSGVLESYLIDLITPVIYFVDNFTSLFDNKIWSTLRNVNHDLIVDIHGNFINYTDLENLVI